MDHVLNAMEPHYEVTLEWFIEEHRTGKYKKLSDNPWYGDIKTLIDAMNIIRKYMGCETIKLSEVVQLYLDNQ